MDTPPRRFAINLSVGSMVGLAALAIVLCSGVLFLFKWVQVANENSRRVRCEFNLARLGYAVYAFDELHGALPPAALAADEPTWAFFVWPYRNGGPPKSMQASKTGKSRGKTSTADDTPPRTPPDLTAVNRYDFGQNCLTPANAALLGGMTWPGFFCPARRAGERLVEVDGLEAQPSDYACVGPTNGVDAFSSDSNAMLVAGKLPPGAATFAKIRSPVTLKDVTDGLSVTAMLGEKHIPEGSLRNSELAIDGGDGPVMLGRPMYFRRLMGEEVHRSLAQGPDDRSADNLFGSWHPGVCLFLMGDLRVKALNNGTDRVVLSALAGRNDGEKTSAVK
jgi:Protein of unknown function (DUF1559)